MLSQLRRKPSKRGSPATAATRRIDRDDFPAILDLRPPAGRRGKRDLDVAHAGPAGIVAQRCAFPVRRGDAKRPLVGKVQERGQPDAAVRVDPAQERRVAQVRIELQHDRLGRIILAPAGDQRQSLVAELEGPPGGGGGGKPLPAIFQARSGSFGNGGPRRRGRRSQRAGTKLAQPQAIDRQAKQLRPRGRKLDREMLAPESERLLAFEDARLLLGRRQPVGQQQACQEQCDGKCPHVHSRLPYGHRSRGPRRGSHREPAGRPKGWKCRRPVKPTFPACAPLGYAPSDNFLHVSQTPTTEIRKLIPA